jgi:hypothetical protein
MNAWAVLVGRKGRNAWGLANRILLAGALAVLVYLVAKILFAAAGGQFDALGRKTLPWGLALAAVVYLVGHGLRILRLAFLIGGWRVGFRVIGSFHLMTAAVSLTAPLKLGEIYRVVELSNIVGSFVRAVVIVWWERAFDVSVIFLILVVALTNASKAATPEFSGVAGLAAIFITVTAVAFFVVPDNLRRLSVFIIRRYDSPHTVPMLRVMDLIRRAVQEAPRIVRGKVASIATLTALIWTCEIACFAIVLAMLGGTPESALDALLGFLSAITRGETLLGVLDGGEAATMGGGRVLAYLAATQVPLAFLGLAAAIYYIGRQMRP